jgi:type II secretory pathway pseudopilin PulG
MINPTRTPRTRRSRSGTTLVELVVVMATFTLVMGAAFGLYLQALRTWYRANAEATAERQAAWAVEQMSWDLRRALRVDDALATQITFTMPLQDSSHRNVITVEDGVPRLSNGDQIMFYLSDDTGYIYGEGDCLWKAVKPVGAAQFAPKKKIAEGICPGCNPVDPDTGQPAPMFLYWPDVFHTRGVQMTVTVVEKGGPRIYQRTESAEAYLRNPI